MYTKPKRNTEYKCFFPVTPFVPNDQLRRLYEQGVISWESYATYALRNTSLPLTDRMKGPPPVDELLFQKPEPKVKEPKAAEEVEDKDKKRKAEDTDKKESKKVKT